MATRLAPGMYGLSPLEGLTFRITADGTVFGVSAALDNRLISFSDGVRVRISPEAMSGLGSSHDLRIRTIFSEESTDVAAYTIDVIDDDGSDLDSLTVRRNPTRPLPFQSLTQIAIDVTG